jgi:hypothetical protein
VQRSLAGVLFLLAGIAFSIALGGWWLRQTALTPDATSGRTEAILNDDRIRGEITAIVSAATAPALEADTAELGRFVDSIIGSRVGAPLMTDIVRDAHARSLGERDDPVRITPEQLAQIVRDERAVESPTVTLPVARIGTLALLRSAFTWIPLAMTAIGVVLVLLGLITRPERKEVVRGLAEFGIALAACLLLFAYALPVHLVPAIDDNTWAAAVPQLALRTMPVVLGASAVLAIGGLALLLAAGSTNRRKQWSTPLSVSRYRDDRSWG